MLSPAHSVNERRVLVVDDNPDDRRLLTDCLRAQGYRLYVAEDGHDGVEKARLVQPDLVVLDVSMPVCDGFAACRLLKSDPQTAGIPVIFLTATADLEDRIQGLQLGAVDYIAKPFNFDEVRLRVNVHLRALPERDPAPVSKVGGPLGAGPGTDRSAQVSHLDALVFRAAQRLLHEQMAHPPDLAGLAKAVGTNPRRLNEAFRNCVGTTVFDYLRELRMVEATQLLRQSCLPVHVIATDLGYDNPANFATAFRHRFGVSPREYRKLSGLDGFDDPALPDGA